MSAIWGTLSFHGNIPQNADICMRSYYESNCKIDRNEHLLQDDVYFGCGIQYTTTEARDEQLPYYDQTANLYFTADCLLDNRAELLAELQETNPSLPDGSLIYRGYQKWGIDCVKHFRGLFSFAIYDKKNTCLYLVADHTSSRCLYYYRNNMQITFSTLLTPIRKLHPEIQANEYYMKDFLTAPGLMPNIAATETPWENVMKLNPGTYLKITADSLEEISYWNPSVSSEKYLCKSAEEYGSYFRVLYENCVKDALRTNGNIGISLSSGLDSASVGALAATHLRKESKSLYTYTYIPYEDTPMDRNRNNVHDETNDVRKIAQLHPNMITCFLNNHGKNCVEEIPHGVNIMEIPYKAYANLPNLCEIYDEASKNGCKIVLTGQTGNSTVSCGYIDHILYDLYRKKKYVTFLSYLNHYSKTVKESRKQALKGCIRYFRHTDKEYADNTFSYTPDNPFLAQSIMTDYPLKERYLQNNIPLRRPLSSESVYHQNLYHKPMFTYLGELDTKLGLTYGIILRDPTRDMRMLSFCRHLPYHLFAYRGTPRWLIRNNLRDILPTDLLDNWMRYGVQNSDYYTRMVRDWHLLHPQLKEQILSPQLQPYIDSVRIEQYFEQTSESLLPDKETDTFYLIMLSVLFQHINRLI